MGFNLHPSLIILKMTQSDCICLSPNDRLMPEKHMLYSGSAPSWQEPLATHHQSWTAYLSDAGLAESSCLFVCAALSAG